MIRIRIRIRIGIRIRIIDKISSPIFSLEEREVGRGKNRVRASKSNNKGKNDQCPNCQVVILMEVMMNLQEQQQMPVSFVVFFSDGGREKSGDGEGG